MAHSHDVKNVRYYAFGSAAQKVELPQKPRTKPKHEKTVSADSAPVIKVDDLAVVGIAVTVVMLLCFAIGIFQTYLINQQLQETELYVSQLELENSELTAQYRQGYDLAEVRAAAQSMGMVPADQARHITVSIPETVEEAELTWWQQLVEDFKAFFA